MERVEQNPTIKEVRQDEEQELRNFDFPTMNDSDRLLTEKRTDAPFRYTDLSTFAMVYDNFSGRGRAGGPVIDKDGSGGASRRELQAYLRDVRRSSMMDKDFVTSYREQFLGGFSERDINKDRELQPGELLEKMPERSYGDDENELAADIAIPSHTERSEIAALRAKTSSEFLPIIDRINTRKDHRVERLLLTFLRDESPEAEKIVKDLDNAKVRVVMRLEEPEVAPLASVSTLRKNKNGVLSSVDGMKLELSSTLQPPFARTLRNELLHVRVNAKVVSDITNGKGFPLSAEDYDRFLDKTLSLDHEIVSSVAQSFDPGEKITFRKFYERMCVGEDRRTEMEKPERYFARAYGGKVFFQRPEAIPIRELLLTHLDSSMSEKELEAFEKFTEAVATLVIENKEEMNVRDFHTRTEGIEEKLDDLNPSRDPDFYYR